MSQGRELPFPAGMSPSKLVGLAEELRRLATFAETSESRWALEELAFRYLASAAGLYADDAATLYNLLRKTAAPAAATSSDRGAVAEVLASVGPTV